MNRVLLLAAAAAMLNRGAGADSHSAFFVDAAPEAGIAFTHTSGAAGRYYLIETMGAGGGFLDYDLDGRLDIYLVDGFPLRGIGEDLQPVNLVDETADHYFVGESGETGAGRSRDADSLVALVRQGGPAPLGNRLYRNRGDRFTAVTGAGDPGYGMGCATGDYDNDGDPDLYVVNYGPNAIFENRAPEGGTFVEATGQAGVGDASWGAGAAFFDYDNDGLLDLYVVNYLDFHVGNHRVCGVEDASLGSAGGTVVRVRKDRRSYCSPDRYRGAADVLYRNTGREFEDASRDAGILLPDGKGLGAVTADYDSDGDTDLYVANDGVRNFLFRNEGGRFREVGLIAGTAYNVDGRPEAGMGVDWGDYDADSDYDLFVTNYSRQTNTLYRNEGGRFSDVTSLLELAGSSYEPLGFGTFFFEADNDGDLDLFVANGHVQDKVQYIAGNDGISYAQPNQLFENRPEKGFVDVSGSRRPRSLTGAGVAGQRPRRLRQRRRPRHPRDQLQRPGPAAAQRPACRTELAVGPADRSFDQGCGGIENRRHLRRRHPGPRGEDQRQLRVGQRHPPALRARRLPDRGEPGDHLAGRRHAGDGRSGPEPVPHHRTAVAARCRSWNPAGEAEQLPRMPPGP